MGSSSSSLYDFDTSVNLLASITSEVDNQSSDSEVTISKLIIENKALNIRKDLSDSDKKLVQCSRLSTIISHFNKIKDSTFINPHQEQLYSEAIKIMGDYLECKEVTE